MRSVNYATLLGLCMTLFSVHLAADELTEIDNYRQYSPYFSSSGQPSAGQFKTLEAAGFKRVIYLAFTDNKTAVESEDRIVKSLGMDYLHIPVDFDNPSIEDFEDFAAVLNRDQGIRTLLHCQINLRASAFSFLYRVIYAGVPMLDAKADLDAIWQPDKTWYRFIVETLKKHGLSQQCDGCDWEMNELN